MFKIAYRITVERIPPQYGEGFIASVAELHDCMACGQTAEESIVNVSKAISARNARATEVPLIPPVVEKKRPRASVSTGTSSAHQMSSRTPREP
jgi:predicted RNase H-like HicB family nuclease